jgi:hypothetical protein
MGTPLTATGPTTYFLLAPATDPQPGAVLSPNFTAPSLAAAQTVAFILATCLQRSVSLAGNAASGLLPPWTPIVPGAANVAITSVPSGIGVA